MVLNEDGTEADPAAALQAARYIARRVCSSLEITLWPLGRCPDLALRAHRRTDEISVIDLAQGADAAIARMDGRARRMAGQAERKGVTCVRAAAASAVEAYYPLLEASARRWGRSQPTIPKNLIESVIRLGGNDVEVWLAMYEGAPIAGGVALFGSEEMYYWTAAMLEEFSSLRPNNALNVALMRRAADRGVRWYNLSSSAGLAGVERFKDSLGAQRVKYSTITVERGTYAAYRALRIVLPRK